MAIRVTAADSRRSDLPTLRGAHSVLGPQDGHVARYLKDEPLYPIYAALDTSSLLSLLPELDRWTEAGMRELRHAADSEAVAPDQDAAVLESLNEARAQWHGRMDQETDAEAIQGIQDLLAKIDEAKAWLSAKRERTHESTSAFSRTVAERLEDLTRRRLVAVKVLSDRGVLPPGLVGD